MANEDRMISKSNGRVSLAARSIVVWDTSIILQSAQKSASIPCSSVQPVHVLPWQRLWATPISGFQRPRALYLASALTRLSGCPAEGNQRTNTDQVPPVGSFQTIPPPFLSNLAVAISPSRSAQPRATKSEAYVHQSTPFTAE